MLAPTCLDLQPDARTSKHIDWWKAIVRRILSMETAMDGAQP